MFNKKENGFMPIKLSGYLLIVLSTFIISCSHNKSIRFDGIYQNEKGRAYSYLRFYKDGTVIAASTESEIEEVLTWFTKEVNSEVGKFQTDGTNFFFSTISPYGESKYEGTVSNHKNNLDFSGYRYDFIDDKSIEFKIGYEFVKIDFPNDSKNKKVKDNAIKEFIYYNDFRQPRLALLLNKAGQVILKKTYEHVKGLNMPITRYTDVLFEKTISLTNKWLLMDTNGNLIRGKSNNPILLDEFKGDIKSTVVPKYWHSPMFKTLDQRTIYRYDGVISKDVKEAEYIWKM